MSELKQERKMPEPEHSRSLRLVNLLITITCIAAACNYTETPPLLTLIYIWFATTGSYVSFYVRNNRHTWMTLIIIAALLLLMFNFAQEIMSEYDLGRVKTLVPFIHVLTGLLTLHTFDLRTRGDINISLLIALMLFSCTAILGRDLTFGLYILVLMILSAVMLYHESIARTKATEERAHRQAAQLPVGIPRRAASGLGILPIAALPGLALFLFMTLPRVDSLSDFVLANFRPSLRLSDLGLPLPGGSSPVSQSPNQQGAGSGQKDQTFNRSGQAQNRQDGAGGNEQGDKKSADRNSNRPNSNTVKTGADQSGRDQAKPKGSSSSLTSNDGQAKNRGTNSGHADESSEAQSRQGTTGTNNSRATNDQGSTEGMGGSVNAKPRARAHLAESDQLVFRNKETANFDRDLFMTVQTSRLVFLKRIIFDQYDGQHWQATLHEKPAVCERLNGEWAELGGVPSLFVPATVNTEQVEQEVTVAMPLGQIIPAADIPQKIDIGKESVTVDGYGILRIQAGLSEDMTYRVISKMPIYNLDELRHLNANEAQTDEAHRQLPEYLQLPKNLPTEVRALAHKITENHSNWFDQAEHICRYLRTQYKYSFEPYQESKGRDLVAEFLFTKKEGACGEFASAFVVMCRAVGIPARCVGGYSPGTLNPSTGLREIRGRDGHAWGEVFIPTVGWVPFDSTPTGTLPEPPKEDNSILATIKQTLQAANAAFEASQIDRRIGRDSEIAYRIRMKDALRRGAQPSQFGRDTLASNPDLTAKSENGEGTTTNSEQNGSTRLPDQAAGPESNSGQAAKGTVNLPWQWIFGVLALVPFIFIFGKELFSRWQQNPNNPRMLKGVKPATLIYLKMAEDLKRLKVIRRPSDTPDELKQRFFAALDTAQDFPPELPALFKHFIHIYLQERFAEGGHNQENYKQLRELGAKIHSLSRGRYTDKSAGKRG